MAGGNQQTFSDWKGGYDPLAENNSQPLLGPTPSFRDAKDRLLVSFGRSPDTQHPDGYLGTMESTRRQDRLLSAVKRQNQRSYSRGVHKGERINPGDYVWPKEFNPQSALQNQALTGLRFVSTGGDPVRLTNDGKAGPRGIPRNLDRPQQELINQERQSMMRRLLPQWR
jgi:hypothetical protein